MIDELRKRIKLGSSQRAGSSLQAQIEIGYDELVEMLGEPNLANDGYKTDAEWELEFDGLRFTIYNYKDGTNYLGSEGTPTEFLTDWHIGGRTKEKAEELKHFLLQYRTGPHSLEPVTEEELNRVFETIKSMDRIDFTKVGELVNSLKSEF